MGDIVTIGLPNNLKRRKKAWESWASSSTVNDARYVCYFLPVKFSWMSTTFKEKNEGVHFVSCPCHPNILHLPTSLSEISFQCSKSHVFIICMIVVIIFVIFSVYQYHISQFSLQCHIHVHCSIISWLIIVIWKW